MFEVKKFVINEKLKHNALSNITFFCKAEKVGFSSLILTHSMRALFFDKVDFDKFEINLKITCLNDGLVQSADKDGCALITGDFYHKNDLSYTSLNLATEINNLSWLKLKTDMIVLKNMNLQLSVFNIDFGKIIKDDENDCIESNIQAALESYQIIKILN